jgi:thiamine biosynthesis protein ThiS
MHTQSKKQLQINGERHELEAETLADVAQHFGIAPETLVAELNGKIFPASEFSTPVSDGDTIELVRFVGGG